ncbi:MAG: hypothetical protein KBT01_04055 [Clostridiales bacterium]|nr:hypothetical protein [Candidatus Blautia equi]
MGTGDWNVSNMIFTLLRDVSGFSYARIAQELKVSEQSLSDWRKGIRMPQKMNIETICRGIPKLLPEMKLESFYSGLKEATKNAGNQVTSSLLNCNSVSDALFYLYSDFQAHLVQDKLYLLLNTSDGNALLREIILKKFRINEKRTPIYQVEELGDTYLEEMQNKTIHWRVDLSHCFLIKFKDPSRKYSYKVLVDFNFNQNEHDAAGDYAEARDAARAYGVKMLLLFGSYPIPHNELRLFIDSNIYAESIRMRDLHTRQSSKDYVYSYSAADAEMEMFANRYADLIIGQLTKYHSVVYKNILFETRRNLQSKHLQQYLFWDTHYATRHHINFQTRRIEQLLKDGSISRGGKALAIGYSSFPCILRLETYFDHIYLLDNSNTSVKNYERMLSEQFGDQNPKLIDKVTFITFTSSMYESISNLHQLYHSLDFVLIGSGSGSFIKKMPAYFRMSNSWLTDDGALYASFLNRDFLYDYVDQITSEQNFAYIPRISENRASVFLANTQEKYDLYCETYEFNELKNQAEKFFTPEIFYSYPLASVLEEPHKKFLQNILKELDKEYSSKGFLSKSFSNSRGYYLDAFLKKKKQPLLEIREPEGISLINLPRATVKDLKYHHLKVLLLTENTRVNRVIDSAEEPFEVTMILLPDERMLPENQEKEILLNGKRLRLLTITEVNALGLEFRHIPVFLQPVDERIRLKCYYDPTITDKPGYYYYLDNTSNTNLYRISSSDLMSYLKNDFESFEREV